MKRKKDTARATLVVSADLMNEALSGRLAAQSLIGKELWNSIRSAMEGRRPIYFLDTVFLVEISNAGTSMLGSATRIKTPSRKSSSVQRKSR